jgi:hypothetical protein
MLIKLIGLAMDVLGLSLREKRVIEQAVDALEKLETSGPYKVKKITVEDKLGDDGSGALIAVILKKA